MSFNPPDLFDVPDGWYQTEVFATYHDSDFWALRIEGRRSTDTELSAEIMAGRLGGPDGSQNSPSAHIYLGKLTWLCDLNGNHTATDWSELMELEA